MISLQNRRAYRRGSANNIEKNQHCAPAKSNRFHIFLVLALIKEATGHHSLFLVFYVKNQCVIIKGRSRQGTIGFFI